jgi:hypothetical protein
MRTSYPYIFIIFPIIILIVITYVRFQVLTAAYMEMTAFWDFAPRGVVVVHWRSELRAACIIRAMMEVVRTSETSVYSTRLLGAISQKAVILVTA